MARSLSSAAKYVLHAARNGSISSLDARGIYITDATMNALERRGLIDVILRTYGHWYVARLTDNGQKTYAEISCPACKGQTIVSSLENDGTGMTCINCRGCGYL